MKKDIKEEDLEKKAKAKKLYLDLENIKYEYYEFLYYF